MLTSHIFIFLFLPSPHFPTISSTLPSIALSMSMVPYLQLLSYLLIEQDEASKIKTSQRWLYQGLQAIEDLSRVAAANQ